MKKIVGVLLLFLAMACSEKNVPESQSVNVPADFSSKTTSFAFDFWNAYEKEEGGTYFLSPLSLNVALGMLLNGTDGQTKKEIQEVLGFSDADMTNINAAYAEIIAKLPQVDPKVTNTMANSVWHKKEFSVESSYLNGLKNSFSAQVFSEDFTSKSTVDKINKWASDNTNDKIKKVIEEIKDYQVLFLMNALYFKGDWTAPFDSENTHKGEFFGEKATKNQDFMYALGEYGYTQTPDFQILELPYGNKKYAFVALLPTEGKTVGDVVKNLNQNTWDSAVKSLASQKVEVVLPKFKMETSKNLTNVLKSLGIKEAFTSGANLTKINKTAPLFVDFVKQDTYLAIDEKGTEAAAVTTIGVGVTSMPIYPMFRCDKPFAFAIVEKTSNTIQFIGKVADL